MLDWKIDRQTEGGVGFANMAFSVLRDMNKLNTTISFPELIIISLSLQVHFLINALIIILLHLDLGMVRLLINLT